MDLTANITDFKYIVKVITKAWSNHVAISY